MKKILTTTIYLVLLTLLFSPAVVAQDSANAAKKGWLKSEKTEFVNSCIESAKASMSADSAAFYCNCMQEKIEVKYPTAADAEKINESMLRSPEWKKMINDCLSQGKWPSRDRIDFISECVREAAKNMSKEKAEEYCACMQFKVEQKYPTIEEASKLTAEDLTKPDWKKMISKCLE